MMIKSKKFLVMLVAAFLIVCFNEMAEVPNNPVADVMIGSSGITWVPKVNYAQMILNISKPDGTVFCKTFDRGASPYINLGDIMGDSSLEGSFTYELQVVPQQVKISRDKLNSEQTGRAREIPLSQTGYFSVRGGMIVTPGAIEPENVISTSTSQDGLSRTQDYVILDDLIVDGSACIGFDCVNGESFGFDTLRLKENNLRIHFQDTSSSAGFPSNDWRITINDSSNGGANYFSVDDVDSGRKPFTIEAGTRANALYVDDSGRIGLGTSTPAEDLHIWYGDTPTVRLHQSGSGWAPQTWDIAGNEANFFIRDVTNGSKLPLRIQPNTSGDTLCLKSSGKVGIGTWSPAFKLEVETTNENCAIVTDRTDGATNYMNATDSFANFGSISNHKLRLVANSGVKMVIEPDGDVAIGGGDDPSPPYKLTVYNDAGTAYGYSDGGTWNTGSSRAFKENIRELNSKEAMESFLKLKPIRFNYKGDQREEQLGFIAEDVPEIVATSNRDAVSAMDIVTLLTKVVQEQQKTISELKREIAALKKK